MQEHGEDSFELDKRARIERVQQQLEQVNQQAKAAVEDLGLRTLELYRQGSLSAADLIPACKSALQLREHAASLQAQIEAIRQEVRPQNLLTCPYCHRPVVAGASFCHTCGRSLALALPIDTGPVCPNCSEPITSEAVFCSNCGYGLISAHAEARPLEVAAVPDVEPDQSPAAELDQAPLDVPASVPDLAAVPPSLPACPNCGTVQRRLGVHFCINCGHRLGEPEDMPAPNAAALAS